MNGNKTILHLLQLCKRDQASDTLARIAMDNFRKRGAKITASSKTRTEQMAELLASREQLRDDLDAIANPPKIEDLDNPVPPERYNRSVNQPNSED